MDDQNIPNTPNNFEALLEEQEGVGVVIAHGEVDLDSASGLKRLLEEAISQCAVAGGVVVDLSRVEFIESVTLGILVEQRNELRDSGKELALVVFAGNGAPEEHPVGRLLGLTGVAGDFSVYDSRVVAVESLAAKS